MSWPWCRKIPWYRKAYRIFHCFMSPFGHVVYLDYLIEDLNFLMVEAE